MKNLIAKHYKQVPILSLPITWVTTELLNNSELLPHVLDGSALKAGIIVVIIFTYGSSRKRLPKRKEKFLLTLLTLFNLKDRKACSI